MSKKLFPINSVPQSVRIRLYSLLTAVEGYRSKVEVLIYADSILILVLRNLDFRPDQLDPPRNVLFPRWTILKSCPITYFPGQVLLKIRWMFYSPC